MEYYHTKVRCDEHGLRRIVRHNPVEKEQLAKRAAKKALKHTYGYDINADQPVYKSVCFEGSKAYITLESGEGLYCCDPKFVYICGGSR